MNHFVDTNSSRFGDVAENQKVTLVTKKQAGLFTNYSYYGFTIPALILFPLIFFWLGLQHLFSHITFLVISLIILILLSAIFINIYYVFFTLMLISKSSFKKIHVFIFVMYIVSVMLILIVFSREILPGGLGYVLIPNIRKILDPSYLVAHFFFWSSMQILSFLVLAITNRWMLNKTMWISIITLPVWIIIDSLIIVSAGWALAY